MLPAYCIGVAVFLRLLGGVSYMRATLAGKAEPSIVSWFFWGLTALLAFTVQLIRGAGPEAFVTLIIGISPLAVCIAALYKGAHRTTLTLADKYCIVLTSLGIVLWLVCRNPLFALVLSILADIASIVPTLIKCYRRPETEHPYTYALSVISMAITLLTITDWRLTHWLFPAYILVINLTLCTAAILPTLPRRIRRLYKIMQADFAYGTTPD